MKNNVYFWNLIKNEIRMPSPPPELLKLFSGPAADSENNLFKFFTIEEEPEGEHLTVSVSQLTVGGGLCICLQGKADIILNGKSYTVQKGDLCVVFPNTLFQAIWKSPDFKGYILSVTTGFIQSIRIPSPAAIYLYIKDNPCISLEKEEQSRLVSLCEWIKKCDLDKRHPYRREILERQLIILCYEIAATYRRGQPIANKPESRKNALFQQFIFLISTHCEAHREVGFYAEKMCITPRYLSAVVKEISGKTARIWIAETVILKIRELLVSSPLTIQQISDRLSFPNPSFFSQFFKKHTGRTPKAYRTENGS